jgi:hypothetical protein
MVSPPRLRLLAGRRPRRRLLTRRQLPQAQALHQQLAELLRRLRKEAHRPPQPLSHTAPTRLTGQAGNTNSTSQHVPGAITPGARSHSSVRKRAVSCKAAQLCAAAEKPGPPGRGPHRGLGHPVAQPVALHVRCRPLQVLVRDGHRDGEAAAGGQGARATSLCPAHPAPAHDGPWTRPQGTRQRADSASHSPPSLPTARTWRRPLRR